MLSLVISFSYMHSFFLNPWLIPEIPLLLVGRVGHQIPVSCLSLASIFPSCPTLCSFPSQCPSSDYLFLSNNSKPQSFKLTFKKKHVMILRVSLLGSDQLLMHFALTGITQWQTAKGRDYLEELTKLLLLPWRGSLESWTQLFPPLLHLVSLKMKHLFLWSLQQGILIS